MTQYALTWSLQVLTVLALQSPAPAPSSTGPAGHWEGTIQTPGQALDIEVDLAPRPGDKWEGAITIPAQHIKALPLSGVTVQASSVSFGMKTVPGDPLFKGTVAKDSKTISGEFSQGGMTMPFALTWKGAARLEPPPKNGPIGKEFEGSWTGTLNAGGTALRLVFTLSNVDGAATGSLVSLDQGAVEIPVVSIAQTASHLRLGVNAIGGTFEGDLKDGQLTGTWAQGGMTLPLVLAPSKK